MPCDDPAFIFFFQYLLFINFLYCDFIFFEKSPFIFVSSSTINNSSTLTYGQPKSFEGTIKRKKEKEEGKKRKGRKKGKEKRKKEDFVET